MSDTVWPPTFRLDGRRILELLTGDRFYSSKDAALREAVLNALDACGRRGFSEDDFRPDIKVEFDKASNILRVSDNGDGMGKEELSDLFAKIGTSASTLAEKTEKEGYHAIGEFGIGVVSYFLVCDRFQVHTKTRSGEAIGVEFDKQMFDPETPATEVAVERTSPGTTVSFFVRNDQLMKLLMDKFPYWIREVDGLVARKTSSGAVLEQGGLGSHVEPTEIEKPEWLDRATIGPPTDLSAWTAWDGQAHVNVLYRGVFVQRVDVPGLWGIEGGLHVDPKRFKPRLNRESFIEEEFIQEITRLLQTVHPLVLSKALEIVRGRLASEEAKEFGISRWVTLWLAVPRSAAYTDAIAEWDTTFWEQPAFRLLDESPDQVSLAQISARGFKTLHIAPRNYQNSPVLSSAVRVLVAKGLPVVQGIARDNGYLASAPIGQNLATDSLLNHFRGRLPELRQIDQAFSETMLAEEETLVEVFSGEPKVRLMKLGAGSAPLVRARGEVWVNVESPSGKALVRELCDRNEGYVGLLVACQMHAPSQLGELATVLQKSQESMQLLGPVKRRLLRKLCE